MHPKPEGKVIYFPSVTYFKYDCFKHQNWTRRTDDGQRLPTKQVVKDTTYCSSKQVFHSRLKSHIMNYIYFWRWDKLWENQTIRWCVASSRRPPNVTMGASRAKYIKQNVARHCRFNESVKSEIYQGAFRFISAIKPPKSLPVRFSAGSFPCASSSSIGF